MKTKQLSFDALLLAVSLIVFIIESYIPPLAPIPGIKLGLANTVTLFARYTLSAKDTFLILLLRIIISCMFGGGLSAFIYSFSGGIFCFLCIYFAKKFIDSTHMHYTGIIGAVAHNIGQICAAVFVTKMTGIIFYVPVLIVSGMITGFFTGTVCKYVSSVLKKTNII